MITQKCNDTSFEFCGMNDPLILLRHFPIGVSLDGLDKIITDPEATKRALLRYRNEELRQTATTVMTTFRNA